jgi:hypothetical protein
MSFAELVNFSVAWVLFWDGVIGFFGLPVQSTGFIAVEATIPNTEDNALCWTTSFRSGNSSF